MQARAVANYSIARGNQILIESGLVFDSPRDTLAEMQSRLSRQLVDLENEAVRSALIKLGWTPPPQ